jgi:hypothetical protein
MELAHVTLTGIKLDKTAPTGSITLNGNYVNTSTVTLALSAADSNSGVAQMCFSNGNNEWSSWDPYATSKTWNLQNGDGTKTVTVQYMDNAGLTSSYSCTTILDTTKPIANAGQNRNANSGTTVTFDAGDSSDESGIVSYLWDFGDGSVGSGVTTTHTYANSGTYPAKVTIQDSSGNIATATVSVTVTPQPTPTPSPSPTIKPTPTITSPSPTPTPSQTPDSSATPQVPELNIEMVFILLAASTLVLVLIFNRNRK